MFLTANNFSNNQIIVMQKSFAHLNITLLYIYIYFCNHFITSQNVPSTLSCPFIISDHTTPQVIWMRLVVCQKERASLYDSWPFSFSFSFFLNNDLCPLKKLNICAYLFNQHLTDRVLNCLYKRISLQLKCLIFKFYQM